MDSLSTASDDCWAIILERHHDGNYSSWQDGWALGLSFAAMAMLKLLSGRNFVINPPICVQIDRKPVTMTDGHHQGSPCPYNIVITFFYIQTPQKLKRNLFIDPLKANICNFDGTGESERVTLLAWSNSADELAYLLLVETIINNRINFSDVTLSWGENQWDTFPVVTPWRVPSTTLISVAQSNINDSSFMFPGFYSAIQI